MPFISRVNGQKPLRPKEPFETDFHSYDGRKDRIQMMQKEDRIELAESNEYRAVSLPYGDKKLP